MIILKFGPDAVQYEIKPWRTTMLKNILFNFAKTFIEVRLIRLIIEQIFFHNAILQ